MSSSASTASSSASPPPPPGAVPSTPKLIALAWPIFVEQVLRVMIGTVDTMMVSHLGDSTVAGVHVANQIVTLFVIAFAFISIGSSIVITHHLGAHDRAGADRISVTAIAANTWIGLIASVVVIAFASPMLGWMQTPDAAAEAALPFLILMGGSLFLEAMNVSIAATLRAHAFTRDAMFVTLGQNVLNAFGNAVMLFGLFGCPKLGVAGVAISGVISRLAATVALRVLLRRRIGLRVPWREFFHLQRKNLRNILRIGLPAAGEHTSWWVAFMVITTFISSLGESSLAAQAYTMNFIRWVIVLNVSLGLGTEIIIGHLIGAGRFEDAYRELLRNLRLGLMIAFGAAVLMALVAPQLVALFTHDPIVIASAALLMRMGVLLEPGRVFNLVVINSLRATGDARFPVVVGLFGMWGIWVPLAWLFGIKLGWGLPGIWISMICDEWIRGLIMYRRWRTRRWLPHAEKSRARARATALGEAEGTTVASG